MTDTELDNNPELKRVLDEEAPENKTGQFAPMYKVVGEAKIPVSKHHGKVWQGRRDAAKADRGPYEESWAEAIKYYNNDQLSHRSTDNYERSGNTVPSRRINDMWSETENIVFANTSTLVPMLYAKNPRAEMTATIQENKALATSYERLVNTLFWTKHSPGVNLKPKARKAVLSALLTNIGWVKIGWTHKEASSEAVLQNIQEIAEKLANAKEQGEIRTLEGQLQALEKHIDVASPEGPFAKYILGRNIYVDPESTECDLSDANWVIESDYLPTEYVNARFGETGKDGDVVSVYQPTHVLKASKGGTTSLDDEVNNFSLFAKENDEAQHYGYNDNNAYKSAQRTLVWWCWDKTTRRVYLYEENNWTWPIWVWEDPTQLLRFFPYYRLSFYDNPEGIWSKGEVTYYLDQQDAINEINDEERRARQWVRRNLMFNKNVITSDDVEAFLKGNDGTARGVDVPEGQSLQDVIFSLSPPSMRYAELFNVDRKLAAINRLASVNGVLRGEQFKTNTTNKAIETYNSMTQTRLDEKIDLIEDFIGDIAWGVAQLCAQFMSPQRVVELIGPEVGNAYKQMRPIELGTSMSMRVVGGSTAKPTSQAKKEEAIQVGQVLGQFADAAPIVVEITLRMFQQAFDEIVMRDEDWQALRESIALQQQQGGAGPQGAGAGAGNIEEIIAQLPPQAQAVVQQAMQQGVPPEEAIRAVSQRMQQ